MTSLDGEVVKRKDGFVIFKSVSGDLSFAYNVVPQEDYSYGSYSNWTSVHSLSDANKVIEEAKREGYAKVSAKWREKVRDINYRFGYLKGKEARKYAQVEGSYGDYAEKMRQKPVHVSKSSRAREHRRRKARKRIYSRGDYQLAYPSKKKCMYCGKQTTRRSGQLGFVICSKCAIKEKARGA